MIACAALVTSLLLFSQALEPRQFEIVVLNSNGAPIPGASLVYSDHVLPETDKDGRFARKIPYSRVLVRKAGYISAFAKRLESGPTIVRLKALPNGGHLPRCPRQNVGFMVRFAHLPKMRMSGEGRDVDFVARSYWFGKKLAATITHGSGPMWGFGFPNQNAVEAEGFAERVYLHPSTKAEIYDFRYRKSDGAYVRSVGQLGETAVYQTTDEGAARELDSILDTVCVARGYE